ncbi:MAG TPA: glycoside hydrolase family 6 protein [Gaiellaceae bacterium]
MRLFVPPPGAAALQQERDLTEAGELADAALLRALVARSHALWLTGGTPEEVEDGVRQTMAQAATRDAVPVLVAYDVPGRDSGQYSAGGAKDTAAYEAWIDGVGRGIGDGEAVVVLEPDSLGLLPERPADRYAQLGRAVDRLAQQPRAHVYLDGTHSAWLDVEEVTARLVAAGVERARGFALNVSNYQTTADLLTYGEQVSDRLGGKHFVIDTSRNGRGPWSGPLGWCNPPGRGAGLRPTADTGVPLLDAYLWVKVPGESDGPCERDDPPAGAWFPRQALELARLADPPLLP